jgi:hypothetical protein
MTAQDIGNTSPGDGSDTLPANPTDVVPSLPTNTLIDYQIPTPLPSNKFSLASPTAEAGLTEIDVRSTAIKDSLTLLQSTLSTLVALELDADEVTQLTLKVLGLVSGGVLQGAEVVTKLARIPFYYDWTPDLESWRLPSAFIFEIVSVEADHLICKRLQDGVAIEETDPDDPNADYEIKVIKNFKLQRTPFDNKTYNGLSYQYSSNIARLATILGSNPIDQEEQVIVPQYVVGDQIGVSRLADPVTVDALGTEQILWRDDNNDGRLWVRRDDL